MNPRAARGELATQSSWGRWEAGHRRAPLGPGGPLPNLSDGRLYEPGGTAQHGLDRLKQHKTAPGWGGPGPIGSAQPDGSVEGSRGGPSA
jgi:hypothetical protein